ncbi:DUF423 domain-containing protein [Reinekea forsetii]|nr:DUF423 domain-containing protein [Reinekea forsetii]
MNRTTIIIGTLMCALSVALGAFGAHAIAEHVSPARLNTWHTASRYLMTQGLGLLGLALLAKTYAVSVKLSAVLLMAGTSLFSAALILLVLFDLPWLGAIAPIGGVLIIIGWLSAARTFFKRL